MKSDVELAVESGFAFSEDDWGFIDQIERFATLIRDEQSAEVEALRDKYNELIMSVGNKYPNETRHETALRYIRKAETTDGVAAMAARPGEKHGN